MLTRIGIKMGSRIRTGIQMTLIHNTDNDIHGVEHFRASFFIL